MIHDKKVSMGVGYVNKVPYEYEGKKFDADIKDGDIIKILDEGQEVKREFKGKMSSSIVHKVETRNGSKAMNVNQTSINNLIDAFGNDSKEWIGKDVKAWIFKVLKDNKFEYHVYLASSKAEMVEGDDGKIKFLLPEKEKIIGMEGEEIDIDPFPEEK